MSRKLIPLIIFLLLAVFVGLGLTRSPGLQPSVLINKQTPQFSLDNLKDADRTFESKDLRGKVSLLNVWASWCVACRAENPVLMKLARSGVVNMVGLNYMDQRGDALRWLEYFGDPYVMSAYDHQGKVGIDLGVYGVPETFIIDKKGFIRYKYSGPVNEEILDKTILILIDRLKAETL